MSHRDCTCGAKHRKDCVCDAAEAIVRDQQRPGMHEGFDRVFAMDGEQLGQVALEAARAPNCPDCRPGDPCAAHAGSY